MQMPWIAVGVLLLAGCAAPRPQPRVRLVPPLQLAPEVVKPEVEKDGPDEEPSSTLLQRGDRDGESYSGPIFRTVIETVEVPVSVPVPAEQAPSYVDAQPSRYRRYAPRQMANPFPVGTAIGAGIGSAIGRRHGHRQRGAWIGAGIGLLYDLNRWRRW